MTLQHLQQSNFNFARIGLGLDGFRPIETRFTKKINK